MCERGGQLFALCVYRACRGAIMVGEPAERAVHALAVSLRGATRDLMLAYLARSATRAHAGALFAGIRAPTEARLAFINVIFARIVALRTQLADALRGGSVPNEPLARGAEGVGSALANVVVVVEGSVARAVLALQVRCAVPRARFSPSARRAVLKGLWIVCARAQ